ncbi:hypothetical protein CC1G_09662 [Coprinopsis cinerea okayama7|uniref:Cytochrome P450 n=1 Tax=Coprinopsis cinerea (strain Okayama-7 / 130 / ATCC MYA-4618 / FGSC 9003) TaxID=240176 RepID=A8P9F2_COPC7|nr:hypothetical protein CC1G_09662 [Coprinopsis cinerea okayama7\|eukprot:XP_001839759.2 hypothetical protein CC1G_09662 [Coprinopsis cinerea okayama7\
MSSWDTQYTILPIVVALGVTLGLSSYFRKCAQRPDTIPTIPTWFPWLGIDNALRFNKNPTLFMEEMRERHGPLYKFTLFGTNMVVLMHPYTLRQLERQSKELSHHLPTVMAAQAASGLAEVDRIVDVMFNELTPITVKGFSLQGMKTSGLREQFHKALENELNAITEPRTMLLSDFVRRTLYRASCMVMFGPTFPIDTYDRFKETIPQLSYLSSRWSRLPWSKAGRNRLVILNSIIDYIRPWWDSDGEENKEQIGEIMLAGLVAMKGSGLSIYEAASGIMTFLWGGNANIWFHLYWMLAQILLDGEVYDEVVREVRCSSGVTEMPLLDSVMWEALRWPYTLQQLRHANTDLNVNLDGTRYFIPKDSWVIPKVLNHDSRVYEQPFEFKPRRFLDNPSLPKPKSFGDGSHMCKGMNFALYQMPDFVATSLRRFDIKLVKRSGKERKIQQSESNSFLPDISKFEEFTIEVIPRSHPNQPTP